jgi:hypothetical protein
MIFGCQLFQGRRRKTFAVWSGIKAQFPFIYGEIRFDKAALFLLFAGVPYSYPSAITCLGMG